MTLPPPRSTLFPYTTLFRSDEEKSVEPIRQAKSGRNPKCHARIAVTNKTADDWAEGERSEEHTSELQSRENLVCRLLLEKKKQLEIQHCLPVHPRQYSQLAA